MTDITPLQKAFITIKKLKKILNEEKSNKKEPIAIIGLSGRFPQAKNKHEFWDLLCQGKNIISNLPIHRWDLLTDTEEHILKDSTHPYWGGYLSNIEMFDAYFFGISPREAVLMDPQQRVLLEVVYEAFEDAGLPIEKLAKSHTGVFASLYASQFGHMLEFKNNVDALYIPTGNAASVAANRISYIFDLRGPSLVLDTACSSSLVTIQTACLNLQNKLCELAVVCGVNINFLPSTNYLLAQAKMLSPDGQCKTFDKEANGYVPGEGAAAIILKPLSKALNDKDQIYAIIDGFAVNQDGKTNGLTAPNGLQQEQLLRLAYQNANIEPKDISYVECHGTGTYLGDPIELEALGKVVSEQREMSSPCLIGSLKTNLGHLEPAAGIAAVIKVALALKNKKIPAHLNYSHSNPYIDFEKYRLKVVTKLEPWSHGGKKRMAGISSFGFGGTNAHIVLKEYTESNFPEIASTNDVELFTLSAKSFAALQELIQRWKIFLTEESAKNLSQLCYCTHVRRSHYRYRLAIITDSVVDLQNKLERLSHDIHATDDNIFLSDEHSTSSNLMLTDESNLFTLAKAYVNQAKVDWVEFEKKRNFYHVDLPLYPWQHKKYWPTFKKQTQINSNQLHPLQGKVIASPLQNKQFGFAFDTQNLPELLDTYHIVHIGYYLEMLAFAFGKLNLNLASTAIEDFNFLSATIVPDNTIVSMYLVVTQANETTYRFEFYHSNENEQQSWTECAKGHFTLEVYSNVSIEPLDVIKQRCTFIPSTEKLYNRILEMGMPAGNSIRWTQQYWKGKNEILCEFQVPEGCQAADRFSLNVHPGVFDGSLQPIFDLLPDDFTTPYMATSVNKIKIDIIKKAPLYLYIKMNEITSDQKLIGTSYLINADNEIITELDTVVLSPLNKKIHINELLKTNQNILNQIPSLEKNNRKPFIINFLIEQVAIIFSIPKEDVMTHLSLKEMGINSLMGLVLIKVLENSFHVAYSIESLLEGPTLSEIADYILEKIQLPKEDLSPSIRLPETPWIAYREKNQAPSARLFCFPYGGGSASVYRDWQKELPYYLEVCPIQLPGRENRLNEKSISNIEILIDCLVDELKPYLDVPFGFFGHSMGALLAYELTDKLRSLNMPLPKHLFVSAFPDPKLPPKSLEKLIKQLEAHNILVDNIDHAEGIGKLSNEQLLALSNAFAENGLTEYKDFLLNKEISKILLPIFVSDMKLIRDYKYREKLPLDLPITVFLSKKDSWIPYEDHLTWVDHTTKKCNFFEYNSGHLFIKNTDILQNILHNIGSAFERVQSKEQA